MLAKAFPVHLTALSRMSEVWEQLVPRELEAWVLECLQYQAWWADQHQDKVEWTDVYPPPIVLLQICAQSKVLFCRAVAVLHTIIRECNFNPVMLKMYRLFIRSALHLASDPVSLLPLHLSGLAHYILIHTAADSLIQEDELFAPSTKFLDDVTSLVCGLSSRLQRSDPICLIYPEIFDRIEILTASESEEEESEED